MSTAVSITVYNNVIDKTTVFKHMLVCYSLHSDYPVIIYSEILFHQRKLCKLEVEQLFLKIK